MSTIPLKKPHSNGDDSDSSGEEHGTIRTHRSSNVHRPSLTPLSETTNGSQRVSTVSNALPQKDTDDKEDRKIRKALCLRVTGAVLIVLTVILLVVVIYLATSPIPIQYCHYKDDEHVTPKDLNNPDVFDDLTNTEYLAVQQFMLEEKSLGLTPWDSATINSSYIFSIELVLPNKRDAIQYLDRGSKRPERKAKVVVVRGDRKPPLVEEYIVSPLPSPTSATVFKDPTFRRHPIPYASRPMDNIDYKFLFPVIISKLTETLYPLLMESYGLCYHNCTKGVNCLNVYDISPRGRKSGDRTSYVWFFPPVDGYYIHPLGLEVLIDHKSTDIKRWKVVKVVYNGQSFDNADDLMTAYRSGTLKLITIRSHKESPAYSSYSPRGKLPDKPVQGPKLTEPEGKRFNIRGQRVTYGNWNFFYHMRPSSGLIIFDLKFDGTRIAYEISLQEVLVFYTGYGPAQGNTNYYDIAWLLGVSNMELVRGVDCPDTAVFLNTYYMTNSAKPELFKNNVCIFENNQGMPLRRHYANDYHGGYDFYGGLSDYVLTIRTVANVWNYDYIFDYNFYTNGAVEVMVSATGYVQATFRLPQEEPYGSIIHDHVMADLHEHVFNYKVDLDIAGITNRYTTLNVGLETIDHPWFKGEKKTQMKIDKKLIKKESNISTVNMSIPQYHLFHNKNAKNQFGEDRAYRIYNKSPINVVMIDQSVAASAQWARYPIIVTKRKDKEQVSTSMYAQHDPWDPIHQFTDYIDGDSLVDQDLVAWVTVGTQHIPGTEDVPSTPTNWNHMSFFISPHNYFSKDPSTSSTDTVVIRPKDESANVVETYGRSFESTCVPKSTGPYDFDGRRK